MRSDNNFQIASPHVRQLHLAVEILKSLSNKSGLTIQIFNSIFFSDYITMKSYFFVAKLPKDM